MGQFIGYYTAVPLKMCAWENWPIKIDFDDEIDWKMANYSTVISSTAYSEIATKYLSGM